MSDSFLKVENKSDVWCISRKREAKFHHHDIEKKQASKSFSIDFCFNLLLCHIYLLQSLYELEIHIMLIFNWLVLTRWN